MAEATSETASARHSCVAISWRRLRRRATIAGAVSATAGAARGPTTPATPAPTGEAGPPERPAAPGDPGPDERCRHDTHRHEDLPRHPERRWGRLAIEHEP